MVVVIESPGVRLEADDLSERVDLRKTTEPETGGVDVVAVALGQPLTGSQDEEVGALGPDSEYTGRPG